MNHEHAIHGPLRRRQEVAAALELAQGQVRQLVANVDAVDAMLRMFQLDLDIGAVWVRPSARGVPKRVLLGLGKRRTLAREGGRGNGARWGMIT